MPPRRAVELRVGGQTYRVLGSDDDRHVQRLADLVDRKFVEVVPQQGRGVTGQQAMFLIAMALAEEAEEQRVRLARLEAERDRSLRLASRARAVVARLLERVDGALSALPAEGSKGAGPSSEVEQPRSPSPVEQHFAGAPDALHEPVWIELMPPSTRDSSWSSAPPPAMASSTLPPPPSRGASPEAAPGPPHDVRPPPPRPGLRLVRRGSSSDEEPR